jgi:hypothetical protein
MSGYVAVDYDNHMVVFALRGTNRHEGRNLIDDLLSLAPQPLNNVCSGCVGAKSFHVSWTDLRPYVIPAINNALRANPGYKLLLVGHSLGGAVINFAALELRGIGIPLQLVGLNTISMLC